MNVFILILVFIFMAGWYLMDSPSQNVEKHGIEYAAKRAEIGSILTCIVHIHSEAVKLDSHLQIEEPVDIFNDTPCAERYEVETVKLCSDGRRITPTCQPTRAGQSINHYIVSTAPAPDDMGKTLELMLAEFPNKTGFGIITRVGRNLQMIIGNGTARNVPDFIVRELGLAEGQLLYISQYAVTGRTALVRETAAALVACPPGQMRVFRFNRWQCAAQGTARACTGATIWDPKTGNCVTDYSRRPLCAANQTAVFVEDSWLCVNPIMHTECPTGFTAHLNYETMEWTCVDNPAEPRQSEQGGRPGRGQGRFQRPGGGATPAAAHIEGASACTDCEDAIIDPETDEVTCVPSVAKLSSTLCYAGRISDCPGAFYFGFPDTGYIAAAARYLPELGNMTISIHHYHSRNRRFNCLSCLIDTDRSNPPLTAVCK
jgi:hypothetical protein